MTARQAMWQRVTLLGTLCCLAGSAPAAAPPPAAAGAAEAGALRKGVALLERQAASLPGISLRFRLLGFPFDALRKPAPLGVLGGRAAAPPAFAYLDDGAAPPASAAARAGRSRP